MEHQLSRQLEELGQRMGMEALAWDEEGVCTLQFGEDVILTMAIEEERDLVIYGIPGVVDEAAAPRVYPELLAGNLFWRDTRGATLSADPNLGTVFLARALEVDSLTVEKWEQALRDFVEVVRFWALRITELSQEASEEKSHQGPEGPSHQGPEGPGFAGDFVKV